jgi:hypothetical protein
MEALAMTPDIQDRMFDMASNLATLVERTKHNDDRLDNLERILEEFRKDMAKELSKINVKLGYYSGLAAIGTAVIIFMIQRFLGK